MLLPSRLLPSFSDLTLVRLTHWKKENIMKRNYSLFKIAVLVVIGTAVAVCAVASCTARAKTVQVTAETIANQSAGKTYVKDLTRRGGRYGGGVGGRVR